MKTFKSFFAATTFAIAAAASTVTVAAPSVVEPSAVASQPASFLVQLIERGQALRAADPVAYDNITGESNYMAQNPQFNVHGS